MLVRREMDDRRQIRMARTVAGLLDVAETVSGLVLLEALDEAGLRLTLDKGHVARTAYYREMGRLVEEGSSRATVRA